MVSSFREPRWMIIVEQTLRRIDLGEKILLLYYSRFPRHTYEALRDHFLCRADSGRDFHYANGAFVRFAKVARVEQKVVYPKVDIYDEAHKMTEAEWLRLAKAMDTAVERGMLYGKAVTIEWDFGEWLRGPYKESDDAE